MTVKKSLNIALRLFMFKMMAVGLFIIFFILLPNVKKDMANWSQESAPRQLTRLLVLNNNEPDYIKINKFIDQAKTDVPKTLIKAIAWCESGWRQFDKNSLPLQGINFKKKKIGKKAEYYYSFDWGLMQINDSSECLNPDYWDNNQIQVDPGYNILAGIAVLEKKKQYVDHLKAKRSWEQVSRRYCLQGHDDLDILIKAYNGFQSSWAYVERVKKTMKTRPWETRMAMQLKMINSGVHQSLTINTDNNYIKSLSQMVKLDVEENHKPLLFDLRIL